MWMNVLSLVMSGLAIVVTLYIGCRQVREGKRSNNLGEETLEDTRKVGVQLEAWIEPVDGQIWSFKVRNVGVRPVRLFLAEFRRGGTSHTEPLGQQVLGPNSTLPVQLHDLGAEVAQNADVTLRYSLAEGSAEMSSWYVSHLETRNE